MTIRAEATNRQGRRTVVTSRLSPDELRALLASLGFTDVEILTPDRKATA